MSIGLSLLLCCSRVHTRRGKGLPSDAQYSPVQRKVHDAAKKIIIRDMMALDPSRGRRLQGSISCKHTLDDVMLKGTTTKGG